MRSVFSFKPAKSEKKQNQQWELSWSDAKHRWYYQDRLTGEVAWEKPEGCKLDAEKTPPPKKPVPPRNYNPSYKRDSELQREQRKKHDLPEGWASVWDPQHKKLYYYNAKTKERTWLPPGNEGRSEDAGDDSDSSAFDGGASFDDGTTSNTITALKGMMGAAHTDTHRNITSGDLSTISQLKQEKTQTKIKGSHHNTDLTQLLWDAETFVLRLRENKQYPVLYQQCLAELKASNNVYIAHSKINIPKTTLVCLQDCEQAVISGDVEPYNFVPIVTMSHQTPAEAAAFFNLDSRRVVVCLNNSSGKEESIGGGYVDGRLDTVWDIEGDLCRRIPNLYPSLEGARQEGLYPFGPVTQFDISERDDYSSVLYTPSAVVCQETGIEKQGCHIMRSGIEKGYAIYSRGMQHRKVGIVSAAAPKKWEKHDAHEEIFDHKLVANTITSIFVAPVREEPRASTLVIGPWGCIGDNAEMVGTLFGDAIVHARTFIGKDPSRSSREIAQPMSLGQLYHEIHFALPISDEGDEKTIAAFVRGLCQAVELTSIPELGPARIPEKTLVPRVVRGPT